MQNIITSSNSSFLNESNIEHNLLNFPGIDDNEIIKDAHNNDFFQDHQPTSLENLDFYSAANSPSKSGLNHVFNEENIDAKNGTKIFKSEYQVNRKHQNFFDEIYNTETSQFVDKNSYFAPDPDRYSEYLISSDSLNPASSNVFDELRHHSKKSWFERSPIQDLKRNQSGLCNSKLQFSRSQSYMSYFKNKLINQEFVSNKPRKKYPYKRYSKGENHSSLSISSSSNAFIKKRTIIRKPSTLRSQVIFDYQISCGDIYDLYADVLSIDTPLLKTEKNIKDNLDFRNNLTNEKYSSWSPLRLFSSNYYDVDNNEERRSSKQFIQKKCHPKAVKFYKPKDASQNVLHPISRTGFNSINDHHCLKHKHSKRQSSKSWFSPKSSCHTKMENEAEGVFGFNKENDCEQISQMNDDDLLILSNDFQKRLSSGVLKQRKQYA